MSEDSVHHSKLPLFTSSQNEVDCLPITKQMKEQQLIYVLKSKNGEFEE